MSGIGTRAVAAALLAAIGGGAEAETSEVSPGGFTVTQQRVVAATPEQAYRGFTELPRWWKSEHSWSGDAANMSLDARAGGCWCERWGEGNSVAHAQVVMTRPGSVLRMHAWLGPLHELPVTGVLTFATGVRDGATRLRVTYRVAGPADAKLDALADAVDRVLGEQVDRLKAHLESPAAAPR